MQLVYSGRCVLQTSVNGLPGLLPTNCIEPCAKWALVLLYTITSWLGPRIVITDTGFTAPNCTNRVMCTSANTLHPTSIRSIPPSHRQSLSDRQVQKLWPMQVRVCWILLINICSFSLFPYTFTDNSFTIQRSKQRPFVHPRFPKCQIN